MLLSRMGKELGIEESKGFGTAVVSTAEEVLVEVVATVGVLVEMVATAGELVEVVSTLVEVVSTARVLVEVVP